VRKYFPVNPVFPHPAISLKKFLRGISFTIFILPFLCNIYAQENPADKLWAEAQAKMQSGRFKEANADFEQFALKAVNNDSRLPEAMFNQGFALSREKGIAFASTLRPWESLIKRFPKSEWSAKALGEIITYYTNLNDPKANTYRRQLTEQFPGSPVTISLTRAEADKLFTDKKYTEAMRLYSTIESSLDENGKKNFLLSKMLAEAGSSPAKLLEAAETVFLSGDDTDKALLQTAKELYLEVLTKSNQLSAEQIARAKTRLGWCHYAGIPDYAEADKAEKLWGEVIAQGKKDDLWVGESQWRLIQLYAGPMNFQKEGQWKVSIKYCDEMIKNFPIGQFRHEQALFSKAWLLRCHGQWQDSLQAFNQLISEYPNKAKQKVIQDYIQECQEHLK